MALRVLGYDRDQAKICVVTDSEETITSVERQDNVLAAGFEFEAAVSQAALVEGLLLQYLILCKLRGFTLPDNVRQKLEEERITFGQVKDALVTLGAFHEPQLGKAVPRYVGQRNRIAHHLISGKHDFDFKSFYTAGREIAFKLWHHILSSTEDQRRMNP